MSLTNDQYQGLAELEHWYRKYNHQIIEISGVRGTGVWDLVQTFISARGIDPREVMYLSYDQKTVMELAAKQYHAYYLPGRIYNYTRYVNFDSLPAVNPNASGAIQYVWKKARKKKVDARYRIMVVFDSVLLNLKTVQDLASFGLPIILMRDPMLLPSEDTYTFLRTPNIELQELNLKYEKDPITHFAQRILQGRSILPGSYDSVTVIPRKQMNLFNLKTAEMTLVLSDLTRDQINGIYRHRILGCKDTTNVNGERVIVQNDLYHETLINETEERIRLYLRKGLVGTLQAVHRHMPGTRFVTMNFQADCYGDPFEDIIMDRYWLNRIEKRSMATIPDEYLELDYAYALTPRMARMYHWDKGILMMDRESCDVSESLMTRMLYTNLTRFHRRATIIL